MTQKPETPDKETDALNNFAGFASFGPAAWMNVAWFENMAELGSEITSFVAERIKEDVKTQHALLQCKTLEEVHHVQAQFLQKAFDQYQAETGKLVEMTGDMAGEMRARTEKKE